MIQVLRYLLFPLTIIYAIITWFRNKLYDFNILSSKKFDLPIICVGNLMVGGTGKTPFTEYLVQLFSSKKVAILSRGYGRKTKGFILATNNSNAEQIGDEPMQYFTKFKAVTVAVCEDRVVGIDHLKKDHDLIILDDAFQHRAVNAGLKIVLFDFQSLLKPQFPFPTGNMRENWSGYKRADLIVITKIPENTSQEITNKLIQKFPGKDVFLSKLTYGNLYHHQSGETLSLDHVKPNVILLSGIAKPESLVNYLSQNSNLIKHFDYPDHYEFKENDFNEIYQFYESINKENVIVVTTEKDLQRIKSSKFSEILIHLPIYFLPISIEFLKDQEVFNQKVIKYVENT
ncbi:tetraacyldisaccharide 4'-kinase [Pedobacter flavus]|uniref:Tetraacyldisaccharide 4'-kinase n=1 Tax=Pedobacter flavus TaxID=3113906 RepID=A0ABU7H0R3_9SPHI|nr:tetraacyldisaccharide 4'-kinase [Pedobacter sp. VNH31]MEE1884921.1 tetraacyldisaccharide 4'-kinase [Pedobacter sp. VNH31]